LICISYQAGAKIFMDDETSLSLRYLATVQAMLDTAVREQIGPIRRAADLIAVSLSQGGLLHVFGTGHSHMLVEELYGRSGGLMPVNAVLIPKLMLHEDMVEATLLERQEDLAREICANQPFQPGDVLLVISNSGRNGLSVEVARLARQMMLQVIALTAVEYSRSLPSRHSSGYRLFETADAVLDNQGLPGDTCLELSDSSIRLGATSTVVGAAVLNALVLETISILSKLGISPPVFRSANLDEKDEMQVVNALNQAGMRMRVSKEEG
jgi:uncharacterized phosphosugar-binding protein